MSLRDPEWGDSPNRCSECYWIFPKTYVKARHCYGIRFIVRKRWIGEVFLVKIWPIEGGVQSWKILYANVANLTLYIQCKESCLAVISTSVVGISRTRPYVTVWRSWRLAGEWILHWSLLASPLWEENSFLNAPLKILDWFWTLIWPMTNTLPKLSLPPGRGYSL